MICIYHSRDLDGWMSAAIVKLWNPKVELFGWDYGDPIPELAFKEVIMVDVSFPKEIMRDNINRITWIDHHQGAILAWQEIELSDLDDKLGNLSGLRNTEFAACELTWKFFFPTEKMPEVVRLLGRYDCFGHKGTDEELKVLEFQYGARANFFDPETCYQALKDWDDNMEHSIQIAGYNIYNYLCVEAQQIYSKRFTVMFDTLKFAMVNQERFNPINFGIDYHKDGYDGFACVWYNKGKWIYSLYNDNGKVDCSDICKSRGGGGHKGAAGFQTNKFILK